MSKLLLVEDNKANRRMVERKLSRQGYEIVEAGDGKTAIDQARAHQPDLVLMDLSLPRMDGWEATRQLQNDERTAGIPVVALTAHAMNGDRESALQAGCQEFVTKPIDFEELEGVITNFLNGQPKT